MTAKTKAVEFSSLSEALGANATEVGETMAKVRPSVRVNTTVEATLVEALVDPAEKGQFSTFRNLFRSDFSVWRSLLRNLVNDARSKDTTHVRATHKF
eukprot:g23146.t1